VKDIKTYILLVGATAFWGANFVVGKQAVGVLAPLTVGAWRFIVAALCMSVIWLLRETPTWPTIRRSLPIYTLLGLVGIFGFNALLFVGLKNTSPVNASLVMALNPLMTALLSAVLVRERLRRPHALGALVSLAGVLLVLTGGSLAQLAHVSRGDLLVFGASVCWALYAILGRKWARESSPLTLSTWTMAVGALCFVPFAPLGHVAASGHQLLLAGAAIAFMAVGGSVLAYLWWVQAVARLGASTTALFFNLVPVWTLLLTLFAGAHVTLVQLGGTVLVLGGVSLATLQRRSTLVRRPAAPAHAA
jgi:drug/metabolite transporter (DMT)-like permease